MARRRDHAPAAPKVADLPPDLAAFPEQYVPGTAGNAARNAAIAQWLSARRAWCEQRGINEHDLPGPRPRRRLIINP